MLYDLGYQSFKTSTVILELIKKLNAVLVDVRYSPKSRDVQWLGTTLAKQLGSQYVHMKDLGNVNYKGSTIVIQNLKKGIKEVESIMATSPVILMCACWDRAGCHRMETVRAFEKKGIPCTNLTKGVVDEILHGAPPPEITQLSLLDLA